MDRTATQSGVIARRRRNICFAVFLCVSLIALGIDRLTKILALNQLGQGQVYDFGLLSFVLVRNPGATLGLGSGFTWVISVFALAVSVAIVCIQVFKTRNAWWSVVLGFIFAGALGNFIDRAIYATGFLNGKVVDFIDYGWSVGNVADVFLTLAVVILILLCIFGVPMGKPSHDSKKFAEKAGADNFEAAGSDAGDSGALSSDATDSYEEV